MGWAAPLLNGAVASRPVGDIWPQLPVPVVPTATGSLGALQRHGAAKDHQPVPWAAIAAWRGNFFRRQIHTQIGPPRNSYPTRALPATGIYANTYGP